MISAEEARALAIGVTAEELLRDIERMITVACAHNTRQMRITEQMARGMNAYIAGTQTNPVLDQVIRHLENIGYSTLKVPADYRYQRDHTPTHIRVSW